uniref:Uncharacterized protein n=1 Tax=Zea mays TaxID=4577 RepID=B6TDJ7_MAIZE|nr:hypothetical protein [Zea mays]
MVVSCSFLPDARSHRPNFLRRGFSARRARPCPQRRRPLLFLQAAAGRASLLSSQPSGFPSVLPTRPGSPSPAAPAFHGRGNVLLLHRISRALPWFAGLRALAPSAGSPLPLPSSSPRPVEFTPARSRRFRCAAFLLPGFHLLGSK